MGEEDDWKEVIKSNLTELIKSTVIGTEFVVLLFVKGLINDEEEDLLSNTITPNINRAKTLYKTTANKWDHYQFEEFKNILKATGNTGALQVFTNAGAEHVQLLRQQKDKSVDGCYEGLSLEEETTANKIVQYARGDQLFKEGKFNLSPDLDRREFIQIVRQFKESLENKSIWWNPWKPKLPLNYIGRSVSGTHCFRHDGTLPSSVQPKTLLEVTEGLVLVVDPPGMGKSSEITNLENQLRDKFRGNRIILRINLNEVQQARLTISEHETASSVVHKLAPFLPFSNLLIPEVRLFLLLDGLDEVCPKHQTAMLNLLHILKSSIDFTDLRVVVTSRPHLREPLEAKFKLNSWSLLPLTLEQQNIYMKAVGVPYEQLTTILGTMTRSVGDLLSIPLMLYMRVDLLKPGDKQFAADVNIYDLYSQFVDAKHEFYCEKKLRIEAKTNHADILRDSMLYLNLPFYYYVAVEELCNFYEHPRGSKDWIKSLAADPPLPVRTQLLSHGLLIEDQHKRLVFKHRSFAEFFYARLLTQEESNSQFVRDKLFSCIYLQYPTLDNLEAFLGAALSKRHEGDQFINITTKWMLTDESVCTRSYLLDRFVNGKLFPQCAPEVLMTFVNGDPRDSWEAVRVLVRRKSRKAFVRLFEWMSKNREWSRRELFKIYEYSEASGFSPAHAMLMVAFAVNFEGQELLSAEEVGIAIRSPRNKLVYIIASLEAEGKWDFVESHLEKGQMRKLFLKADDEDFVRIVEDKETAWKLVANLSEEEIFSLVRKEESRVSDIVGRNPLKVSIVLGKKFLSGLWEFRGKFGDDKGKTVFELSESGCQFALDLLWGDLLKEKDEKNCDGPVTVALREALARSSKYLLERLVDAVRRRRKCPRAKDISLLTREWEESDGVMEWIFRGAPFWESSHSFPPEFFPFAVRYSGDPHRRLVGSILQAANFHDFGMPTIMDTLRSLVLSANSTDDDNSKNIFQLAAFLRRNTRELSAEQFVRVFVDASMKELKAATPTSTHSQLPTFDVSVGQVFIQLITNLSKGAVDVDGNFTWLLVVRDVIEFTPCCDLLAVLHEVKGKMDERELREILNRSDVISQWTKRFSSKQRRKDEDFACGLSHLLAFYFSVFGLTFSWANVRNGQPAKWDFVKLLPAEVAAVLQGNPLWTSLLPQFADLARSVDRNEGILLNVSYRTEAEWERLLTLIGEEGRILSGSPAKLTTKCGVNAAPLIRVFVRMFGAERAKVKVSNLWDFVYCYKHLFRESPESQGSLLHSAIELGELVEVEKRDWPGILTWRNPQGNDALQVAMETCGENHPITRLIHSRAFSRRSLKTESYLNLVKLPNRCLILFICICFITFVVILWGFNYRCHDIKNFHSLLINSA